MNRKEVMQLKGKEQNERRGRSAVATAIGAAAVAVVAASPPHGALPGALLGWSVFVYAIAAAALVVVGVLVVGVCERLASGETPSEIGPRGIRYPSAPTAEALDRISELENGRDNDVGALRAMRRGQIANATKAKANETKVQKQLDRHERDIAELKRRWEDGDR